MKLCEKKSSFPAFVSFLLLSFVSQISSATDVEQAVINTCKTGHYNKVFDPLPLEFYSDSCQLKGKENSFRNIIAKTYEIGLSLGNCNYFLPQTQGTIDASSAFGLPGPGFKKLSDEVIACENKVELQRQTLIEKIEECFNRAAMIKLIDQAKFCGDKAYLVSGVEKYRDIYYDICLIKKKSTAKCKQLADFAYADYKSNFSNEKSMQDFEPRKYFENSINKLANKISDCSNGNATDCYSKAVEKIKEKKTAEALKLFEKSCDGDYATSCYILGIGELEMAHLSKARKLFIKACNGDEYDGCYQLGLLDKRTGKLKPAAENFKKACEGDVKLACDEVEKNK